MNWELIKIKDVRPGDLYVYSPSFDMYRHDEEILKIEKRTGVRGEEVLIYTESGPIMRAPEDKVPVIRKSFLARIHKLFSPAWLVLELLGLTIFAISFTLLTIYGNSAAMRSLLGLAGIIIGSGVLLQLDERKRRGF